METQPEAPNGRKPTKGINTGERVERVAETVIAVGSTNPAKVGAAAAVARRAFPGARVVPVAVASGVAAQPMSAAETAAGARHRARAALAAVPGAAYGIGLEGGVEPTAGGGGDLVNCCAIAARGGRVSEAWGVRFPLPPQVVARLLAGEELAPVIDELAGTPAAKGRLGAVGILTGGLLTREELWEQAILCALIPHRHPELYPLDTDRSSA